MVLKRGTDLVRSVSQDRVGSVLEHKLNCQQIDGGTAEDWGWKDGDDLERVQPAEEEGVLQMRVVFWWWDIYQLGWLAVI